MVNRLVAVDDADYRLPDPVRTQLAAELEDAGTEVGAVLEGLITDVTGDAAAADRLALDLADQAFQALSTFHHAVELRNTKPVNVVIAGDSNTLGVSPANGTTRWASVMRDQLRRLRPSASNPAGGYGFYSASSAQNSPVVTTSGVTVAQGTAAFSADSYTWRAYGPGDDQVYPFTGTGADLCYWKNPTGQGTGFRWSVDGGATTTVITDAAYTAPLAIQIRGLTAGDHTVKAEWAVGSNPDTTYYSGIGGLYAYNGDENEGFRVLAGGIAGGTTGTWNAMASGPYEIAKLYAPDLVLLPLGTNDYGGTVPLEPSAYKTNLQGMISKYKARTTGKVPSFVIVFPPEIYKASPLAPFDAYRAAAYEVAAADRNNVAVFDVGRRINPIPTFNSTLGGLMHTDYVHYTGVNSVDASLLSGHAYFATALVRFLLTGQSAA